MIGNDSFVFREENTEVVQRAFVVAYAERYCVTAADVDARADDVALREECG